MLRCGAWFRVKNKVSAGGPPPPDGYIVVSSDLGADYLYRIALDADCGEEVQVGILPLAC